MSKPAPKFAVGDAVDFANDYGVIFSGKTITGIHPKGDSFEYEIAPTTTPWVRNPERALVRPGELRRDVPLCRYYGGKLHPESDAIRKKVYSAEADFRKRFGAREPVLTTALSNLCAGLTVTFPTLDYDTEGLIFAEWERILAAFKAQGVSIFQNGRTCCLR